MAATFLAASGSGDGQFISPNAVGVASDGSVYVSDSANNHIQKFTSEGVFLTKWGKRGQGDGEFTSPTGLAMDRKVNVYVAERLNNRVQVFKRVILNKA